MMTIIDKIRTLAEIDIFSSWMYITKYGDKHIVDFVYLQETIPDFSETAILGVVDSLLNRHDGCICEDDMDENLAQKLNDYRNSKKLK